MPTFSPTQKAQLDERGIAEDEAARQLALLASPPSYTELVRPAVAGDGIERIEPERQEALIATHEQATREGRCAKFVPASGAASRMFQGLRNGTDVRAFLEELPRLPFVDDLRAELAFRGYDLDVLRVAGSEREILDALLGAEGLDYEAMPKGLIPFHRYGDGVRTAIEEHLAEAAETAGRLHVTVAPEHLHAFRLHADRAAPENGIAWSVQRGSTDTIAGDPAGGPFTTEDGRLLLRPSGHGALLGNLQDVDADVVLVKNIDNVQRKGRREATIRWKKILGGRLIELQRDVHLHVARLRGDAIAASALEEATEFARRSFGIEASAAAELLAALDRPVRVCGVVANTGEPGGGPFWVRGKGGRVSRQIVESAQIDPARDDQKAVFRSSTHFNPVDLACGMRDAAGAKFSLKKFVDPGTSIVTRKTYAGRELVALERPGLWNGAMAGWLTAFVEVPTETFTPVKTVMDLLRPEHQP